MIDFGLFTFDPSAISDFLASRDTLQLLGDIYVTFGWLALVYLLLYALVHLWEEYKAHAYQHNWQWVLLAVDVPMLNVQTPKAVEQLFAHLAGAHDKPNIANKYRVGYKQRWFSFEIISIEGYIQFLIRTEVAFRDLVEAAVYAQYPEAEVIEVEDYVDSVPSKYPNETHDIWAADFALTEKDAYPIRTYREFEHSISKDTVLKDPMGTFLESFTRIGPGEQVWFQIILEPIGNEWKEKAIKQIKEVVGEEEHHKGHAILDALWDNLVKSIEQFGDFIFGREASEAGGHEEKEGPKNLVQFLTPGQKTIVEAMENKIAKVGFKTKMRAVYAARKEVFNPNRAIQAIQGAMKQYNIPSANSIAPAFTTSRSYFFKRQRIAYRKRLLMQAYKKRKLKTGASPFVLNIEELATVWHFPMSHVKTPLLSKTTVKRTEPPAGLPVEQVLEPTPEEKKEAERPPRKSYRTDAGDVGYGSDQDFG